MKRALFIVGGLLPSLAQAQDSLDLEPLMDGIGTALIILGVLALLALFTVARGIAFLIRLVVRLLRASTAPTQAVPVSSSKNA